MSLSFTVKYTLTYVQIVVHRTNSCKFVLKLIDFRVLVDMSRSHGLKVIVLN